MMVNDDLFSINQKLVQASQENSEQLAEFQIEASHQSFYTLTEKMVLKINNPSKVKIITLF